MWIRIKELADIVGISPRAVQLRVRREPSIAIRPADGRSVELSVPTLPLEWQTAVARAGGLSDERTALAPPPAKPAAGGGASLGRALSVLSREPSGRDRLRAQAAQMVRAGARIDSVAYRLGVSPSTVRRMAKDADAYGVAGKPRAARARTSFCPEAQAYLKAYYLQALKETGCESKKTAWLALQMKAKEEGWAIGGRSTAYAVLSEISPLHLRYAKEGNRGLDNIFYISRDCMALRPFQIVIGDQHIFDWWVADYEAGTIRRPECYLWLDMGTKLVYGLAFAEKHYNAQTVKEALRFGLYRFGGFEATYNDNGSAECSRATTEVIDDLLRLGMRSRDVSELYKTADGSYAIPGEDGKIAESARTVKDFRRIYAQVRNAKAKDIERFFRTLETRLEARCLPGKAANPAANAAEDEVERARLERQKGRRELLTERQFAQVVCEEIVAYEQTVHGSLRGMSPREALAAKAKGGWRQRRIDLDLVDFILFERRVCKVRDGRVLLNGSYYIGAPQTASAGRLDDVGLWAYEGQKVEIRFSRYSPDFCLANVGNGPAPVRILTPVQSQVMLDDGALKEAMAAKRRQMRAVRETFADLTAIVPSLTYRPPEETVVDIADAGPAGGAAGQASEDEDPPERLPFISLSDRSTPRKRYQWCLDMLIAGNQLSSGDKRFLLEYRMTDEYRDSSPRWRLLEAAIKEA